MNATFTFGNVSYEGDLDEQGNGTLFGSRDRELGDAHMSGTHKKATSSIAVENFRAVEYGDKRYELGEVAVAR